MARTTSSLLLAAACCLLAACAGWLDYTKGREMMAAGDTTGALAKLEAAVKAAPDNFEYRQTYEQDKGLAVERWVSEGDLFRGSGDLDRAEADYRRALRYDPPNQDAQAGLGLIEQRRQNLAAVKAARRDIELGAFDQAERSLKQVLAQDGSLVEARELLSRIYEKRAAAAVPTQPTLKSAF